MKLTVLALCAAMIACQSTAIVTPATQVAQPTPTIAALPARLVQRVQVTPTIAVHRCTVTADVLTVRSCGGVQCAAIDWLMAGEVVTTTQVISGWVFTGGGWVNSKFCEEVK